MSRLQTPIRRNDTVVITTGKDSGKRGRVLKVLPLKNRLIVEGVNMIKRHTRPNPQRNVKGGIDFNNNTAFVNDPRTFGIAARFKY